MGYKSFPAWSLEKSLRETSVVRAREIFLTFLFIPAKMLDVLTSKNNFSETT